MKSKIIHTNPKCVIFNHQQTKILQQKMINTAETVWRNCLSFIKDNIQPQAYKTWFEPISAIKSSDHSLSIQVPSKFFYEWLEEHYVKILKVALTKELGMKPSLFTLSKWKTHMATNNPSLKKFQVPTDPRLNHNKLTSRLKIKNPELKNPFVIPGIRNVKIESQLNPIYTFENFLEGDSNRLARNAGIAVANKPVEHPLIHCLFLEVLVWAKHIWHMQLVLISKINIPKKRFFTFLLKNLPNNTLNQLRKTTATILFIFIKLSMC